jgi:outer membrane lipoprotein-sorting protein
LLSSFLERRFNVKKILYVYVAIILFILKANILAQDNTKLNDIIYNALLYDDVIKSGSGSYEFKHYYNNVIFEDFIIEYYFENIKFRCEIFKNDIFRLQNSVLVYNGERFDRISTTTMTNGIVTQTGFISDNFSSSEYNLYRGQYDPFKYQKVGILLKDSIDNNYSLSYKGEEVLNDIKCYLIESIYHSATDSEKISYWIAPEYEYRMIKMIDNIPNFIRVIDISYEINNDIYRPKYIYIYNYNTKDNIEPKLYSKMVYIISDKWKFNASLPDSIFEINYPIGMKVVDQRK